MADNLEWQLWVQNCRDVTVNHYIIFSKKEEKFTDKEKRICRKPRPPMSSKEMALKIFKLKQMVDMLGKDSTTTKPPSLFSPRNAW